MLVYFCAGDTSGRGGRVHGMGEQPVLGTRSVSGLRQLNGMMNSDSSARTKSSWTRSSPLERKRQVQTSLSLVGAEEGEGVERLLVGFGAQVVLGGLHGRQKTGTAAIVVEGVDVAGVVGIDDCGGVLGAEAAVVEAVRQDDHGGGEAVAAGVGGLPDLVAGIGGHGEVDGTPSVAQQRSRLPLVQTRKSGSSCLWAA